MIIDWQHHFAPYEVYNSLYGKQGKPGQALCIGGKVGSHFREEAYQIDKHLEFMDAAGINIAVLSPPGLRNVQECKLVDENYANIMKQYPDRFVGLAQCIPTQGDEALKELDRAINVLGLKGVQIFPQIEGAAIDSEKLLPFYSMVSKLNVPIFVHVTSFPIGYDAFDAPYNLNVTLTRECDVTSATVRLILGGIMTKFPRLKFVVAHMGGGIASTLERYLLYIDMWKNGFWTEQGGTPPFGMPFSKNFKDLFNKMYFDMAGFECGMNAIRCALTTISPEKLLFATDYPFNFNNNPGGVKKLY